MDRHIRSRKGRKFTSVQKIAHSSRENYTKNKNTYFTAQEPWAKRDYVPDPDGTDDMVVGSHEWCKAYVPWHEGLTFDMISWQRACDTNNDGVYDEDDNNWPDEG